MPNRKLEIGKGLKALISDIDDIDIEEKKRKVKELSRQVAEVEIDTIVTNPFQPRREFDEKALQELSDSIRLHGIIQPLTVRALGSDNYQLISGERRLRASKLAGLTAVPAYIRIADDQGLLEMALIENIQREDLNVIEVASAYQRLIEECSLTHQELSERVGKNRSSVTNYLRLLKLPPSIKNALRSEKISMGHARSIAGLNKVEDQLDLYAAIQQGELSVRETEKKVKNYAEFPLKPRNAPKELPADWRGVQDHLRERLDSEVHIKLNNSGGGSIHIKFENTHHFNEIMERLS